MPDALQKITLLDLVDIKFLQKLQDKFAKTIDVGCFMIDTDGPITKPSNFSYFCLKYARENIIGLSRCNNCIKKWGAIAAKNAKPVVFNCPMGLAGFSIPILVNGVNIASIMGGQVFINKSPSEKFFRNMAKELDTDEEKYLEDAKKIKVFPRKKIQEAVDLLFLVANSISEIAHKNYELIDKNKREEVSNKIIAKIRSTLNAEEIKKYFTQITGDYFDADRCFFIDFDKNNKLFLPFRLEKLKSPTIKSLIGINPEEEFPEFCAKLKNKKNIIIKDLEKTLSRKSLLGYKSVKTLRVGDVKSDYGIIVKYRDQIIGTLVIHFIKEKKLLTHKDFDFLRIITKQAGTALYQAELYSTVKQQAQREALIRRVTETIRSTIDIEKMKHIIVDIIGKTLDADRCFIVDYNKEKERFLIVKDEYISSKDTISYKGFDSNIEVPNFVQAFQRGQILLINDKKIFINNERKYFETEGNAIEKFGINSAFTIPLFYSDALLGTLAVHYTRGHFIDADEINLLTIMANQVSIAIYQAGLFKATEEQAKREMLLRNVAEAIRNSLDVNETKKRIVNNIGKALNADRCFIMEYNQKLDNFLIVDEEYLSSSEVISYKGVDLNEHIPHFAVELKKGKRLIINENRFLIDDESFDIDDEQLVAEKAAIEKYKAYSALVFPISYKNEFLGDLVLHYVDKQRDVGEDEIKFLNLITNQIAIALHQAKLYEKIQLQAERERISQNIIEIMRNTLDKNIIKHLFVKNIGKYFNADRVYFSEYNSNLNKYLPVEEKSEYLSSSKEKSFVNYDLSNSIMAEHMQLLMEKRERIIPNWKEYIEKHPQTPEFISFHSETKIKSSYSFPVLYEGTMMGYFCVAFTSKTCELTDDDIKRIRSICSQAGIALYHAELYLKTQEALQAKSRIIAKVKRSIQEPVESIIKNSKTLSEIELARDKQIEYLDNIINSCNELLELTKNILDVR